MDSPEARQRFAAFLARPETEARLAEGALLIAQQEYPALEVEAYLQRLDAMAEAVKQQLGLELEPRRIVATINTYLFKDQGFHGNLDHYYDPRNSFLHAVLDRKIGIPITLSVLYLEIGRHVGLPTVGVGMPGHFIVQYTAQAESFWIDPFHGGAVLSREDCAMRLQQIYGRTVTWHDAYLRPVSDRNILRRMLGNLKGIYVQQGDFRRALSIVEYLLLIAPDVATEVRDRGLLRSRLGDLESALDDLQHYLQLDPGTPDAPLITKHIAALRANLKP